jgi:hypothetical protein
MSILLSLPFRFAITMSQMQNPGQDPSCVHSENGGGMGRAADEGADPSGLVSSPLETDGLDVALQRDTGKLTEEEPVACRTPTEAEAMQAVEDNHDISLSRSTALPVSDKGRALVWRGKGVKQVPVPVPHHAVSRGLSNLNVVWKKSNPKLAEKHDGRDVCFSVYVGANMGPGADNVTIGSLIHLPCCVELAATPNQMVEVSFVVRSKRGCTFVVFDESTDSFSFVKPIDIVAILEYLPNRKAVARTRIGAAIVELGRGPRVVHKVPAKRGRCESWQVALLDFLVCMINENTGDEEKAKLETLRKSLLEDNRPVKKAKPMPVVAETA